MESVNIKSVTCYFGNQSKSYTSHDKVILDGKGLVICYSDEVKTKTALQGNIYVAASAIDKMVLVDGCLLVWLNAWQVGYMNK